MPQLAAPLPVTVRDAPAEDDLLTRSELTAYVAQGAAVITSLLGRGMVDDLAPHRALISAGAAERSRGGPVLDVLDTVVDGIVYGQDISASYPAIARLIHAQEQRAEVVDGLLLANDYDRLRSAARARDRLEESLIAAAMNDTLLPAERVVLRRELNDMIGEIRKRVGGASTSVNDIIGLLEKMDYKIETAGAQLRERFAKTTPQGREVTRKLLMRVGKAVREAGDTHDA